MFFLTTFNLAWSGFYPWSTLTLNHNTPLHVTVVAAVISWTMALIVFLNGADSTFQSSLLILSLFLRVYPSYHLHVSHTFYEQFDFNSSPLSHKSFPGQLAAFDFSCSVWQPFQYYIYIYHFFLLFLNDCTHVMN